MINPNNFMSLIISFSMLIFPAGEHKVSRKLTPIDGDDLIKVLNESYVNVYGTLPHENLLAGAWAHIALENQHGRKIWNHNLGNIGNLPNHPPGPYYSHFGKAKYKSHKSFVAGGEQYWRFMSRCSIALKNFKLASPKEASLSLKRCNYYRSNQEDYSIALSSLYATGLKKSKVFKRRE
jgi:hypothetical protein